MKNPRALLRLAGLLAVLATMIAGVFAATPTASAAPVATVATVESGTTTAAPVAERVDPRARCRVRRCFGAIAINLRTGVSAYSYNYPTRSKAVYAAKKRCRAASPGAYDRSCRTGVWVRNGCAAVAYRTRNGRLVEWAGRYAFNKRPAIRKAKRAVAGPGTERTWAWVCTSRRR